MPKLSSWMDVTSDLYLKYVPDDTESIAYKVIVLKEDLDIETANMGCDMYKAMDPSDTSSAVYATMCGGVGFSAGNILCATYKDSYPGDTTSEGYDLACNAWRSGATAVTTIGVALVLAISALAF